MTIYHTSPRTGGTARCRAIGACPYGATYGTSILKDGTTAFGTASPTWRDMKELPKGRSEERIVVDPNGEVKNVWSVENRKLRSASLVEEPVQKSSPTLKKEKGVQLPPEAFPDEFGKDENDVDNIDFGTDVHDGNSIHGASTNTAAETVEKEKTGTFTPGKDQPTEKSVNIDDMIANYQHWDATVDRNYRGGTEKFYNLEQKQVKRAATRIAKLETERQQGAIELSNRKQRDMNEEENNHPEYNMMKQPETIFTAEHFITLWEKNNTQN